MGLLGAGIAAGLAALGAGLGNGLLFSKYMDASARQPELEPTFKSSALLMFALVEALPILAIVLAFILSTK
ncbi:MULTISPECIES: F0F1 ATP synthase subunit C [unclassified Gemella]|uniref:F0F1 ATP synthase subunit C n=1 Tax=unclassified Gemella TaxID=2624949 RepID=UPI0010749BB0|nr:MULTISPECIES: F0F1 ATP synthase subunit C [unclassified Gemella]MBF0709654.1 F0F1 ATP synthase subunit C [Gemella sp. GL1.1]MBF0746927.1 F0F1 ATP synthase subunit C [Gemella sp. 19428wG2_WT2a]NYS26998.1 F0F1 ATP synthase subunit C [Gemella sp. GL1]TFU59153.1 F0F1 ATP synthase subunit C [Gemella sp. WT2a]